MEKIPNLHEYRSERTEELRLQIVHILDTFLAQRPDNHYSYFFSPESNIREFRVHVVDPMSFKGDSLASAPQFILNEALIEIANYFSHHDEFAYTVNLSGLDEEPPCILIQKM